MKKSAQLKAALLAAASLTAASAVIQVHASPPAAPVISTAIAIEHVAASANPADQAAVAPDSVKRLALSAAVAAVLTAILKIVGIKRIFGALGKAGLTIAPAIVKGARVAARAPAIAARAVGSSLASPVRFAMVLGGLGLFAFTGIGLLDLEWTAGLGVGAALASLAWIGADKFRRRLVWRRAANHRQSPGSAAKRSE